MSKQVSAENVFKQGLGDRYQTSDNFEGLLQNAVATPINENENIDGLEEATTNITATGQKPDLITVNEWAEKRGYQKSKDKKDAGGGDDDESNEKVDKNDDKVDADDENKTKEN